MFNFIDICIPVSGSVGRGDTYMLSGCELIDIDMKFGGE
jgi:hypothetical protein